MEYDKPFNGYEDGTSFWTDTAISHGVDEAMRICGTYLDMQLKSEVSDSEERFCRELFAVMYEATSEKIVPSRLYYPYDFKTASERGEDSYYYRNLEMNRECARAIDEAISASCYKRDFYNLKLAAMSVIGVHGFSRVNAVIAHHIQGHERDSRYNRGIKKWAGHFTIPENTCGFLRSHACLMNDFAEYVRKLNADSDSTLPGRSEYDEPDNVDGAETIRSIMFGENQGFAIAQNPDAPDDYTCWQFAEDNGRREYSQAFYGDKRTVADEYNARLFVRAIQI